MDHSRHMHQIRKDGARRAYERRQREADRMYPQAPRGILFAK